MHRHHLLISHRNGYVAGTDLVQQKYATEHPFREIHHLDSFGTCSSEEIVCNTVNFNVARLSVHQPVAQFHSIQCCCNMFPSTYAMSIPNLCCRNVWFHENAPDLGLAPFMREYLGPRNGQSIWSVTFPNQLSTPTLRPSELFLHYNLVCWDGEPSCCDG